MYLKRKTLLATPEYRKIYEFLRDFPDRSAYDVHANSPELNINQVKNALNRMSSIGLIEQTSKDRAGNKRGRAIVCWSAVVGKNITEIFAMSDTQPQVPESRPQIAEAQTLDILDHEVVFKHPQEMISNESLSPFEG
jgi:Fe2+ or Zn2+ uptake regulation protein